MIGSTCCGDSPDRAPAGHKINGRNAPMTVGTDTKADRAMDAKTYRKTACLRRDLGVNLEGAAIIVDLVERLDALQRELTRRRGG